MIARCNCVHKFQDKVHGKGRRVFNALGRDRMGRTNGSARCTVCGNVKDVAPARAKK